MSKQEVKDEAKQYDGNPQIKSAIRSKQMQMARMRMMKEVPEATVVVTNPTHIAIALKYEPKNKQDAPIVVAKGKLKLAERIKAIAKNMASLSLKTNHWLGDFTMSVKWAKKFRLHSIRL